MKNTLAAAIVLALSATSSLAQAADTRINGFASVVAGLTNDEDTSMFGYNDNISFKPESLFALQIASDLGDGLSATAQIMSRGSNDYAAEFEWAYLSYEISDSTQINAGKLRIPFYRYSDFLDVGYAYTWARPPQAVYSLVFSTFDGLSIVNNHTLGNWDSSIQVIYGSYDGSVDLVSDEDPATLNNIMGINWTLTYDWFTARAIYAQAETSISFENNEDPDRLLNNGIALVGNIYPQVASDLNVDDDIGSFIGLGFAVDYNNLLIEAEFTTVDVENSIVAKQEQYYVSVGYRIYDFTIYAITEHGEDTNEGDYDYSSVLPVSLDITGYGTVYPQGTYQALIASQEETIDTATIGARYNFHPSAALKLDITSTKINDADAINVLSVGVDLVF
ncbi:porin [uncultured Psychrosphaera sp.]|uniref:porin n=1 Tax=uncultured Psychrosphaera sp. TaxID=1403522 RepID=UPI002604C23A|nr:porin [uncultured Psychrosphaera sp.]